MLQFIFPYLRTRTLSGPKPIPLIPENDQDKNKVRTKCINIYRHKVLNNSDITNFLKNNC